jgi:hypothetical protein
MGISRHPIVATRLSVKIKAIPQGECPKDISDFGFSKCELISSLGYPFFDGKIPDMFLDY